MLRFLFIGCVAGFLGVARGPSPVTAGSQDPPVFSSSTQLVVLHVSVQDRRGGFISDLPREAFAVLEDGQPQRVTLFINEESAVTVGLVIDNSISMQPHRDLVLAATDAFARSVQSQDQLFAVVFNEHVRRVLQTREPFTNEARVLHAALSAAITARGRTALFDALLDGLAYADQSEHQRKVLVVIGDGGDNESTHSFADVLRHAQASNVRIYAIALVDPVDRDANPKRFRQLAEATGGQMFAPRDPRNVNDALQRIAADIRHTYTLGYEPARGADGTFRQVSVHVTPPPGVRPVVRTRTGYLAARHRAPEAGP